MSKGSPHTPLEIFMLTIFVLINLVLAFLLYPVFKFIEFYDLVLGRSP